MWTSVALLPVLAFVEHPTRRTAKSATARLARPGRGYGPWRPSACFPVTSCACSNVLHESAKGGRNESQHEDSRCFSTGLDCHASRWLQHRGLRADAGTPAPAAPWSPRDSDPSGTQRLESKINCVHQGLQCKEG